MTKSHHFFWDMRQTSGFVRALPGQLPPQDPNCADNRPSDPDVEEARNRPVFIIKGFRFSVGFVCPSPGRTSESRCDTRNPRE